MLPTFVIALREGIEASLIVGIVAAFLASNGDRRAVRWMWVGVGAGVTICLGVGIGLDALDRSLPQAGQERLESVIALTAVAMVTWMIVWMKRNARGLRASLEHSAAAALAAGTVLALVAMAFLAVLREGFETAVFLLAAFDSSTDPTAAGMGVILGLRRGGRHRLRDLPGWRPVQPEPVLPHHRRRAGAHRGRARLLRDPHGPRGRLAVRVRRPRRSTSTGSSRLEPCEPRS